MAESTKKQFVTTEACMFKGRWYPRGAVIEADATTKHKCLKPYSGKTKDDNKVYFDPMSDFIQKRKLAEVTGMDIREISRGVKLSSPAAKGTEGTN